MSVAALGSGRTWDEAASPAATRLARQFEAAWRAAQGRRPDPADYLSADPALRAGALLALLRTELTLRREAGEPVRLEGYRDHYPELGTEGLVALIYEEFCLREEAGEAPDPAEYAGRFPEVAAALRRVLEIHGLVGASQSASFPPAASAAPPFPEAGQTIAGFYLVEELGRGGFARVFRAQERQLADRPVALKVATRGSREPQTLARLQHAHIVPVHSYRIDPVTGLHLLCMPYLGRLTLARVLADPTARAARSGAELVAALDRLQPDDVAPAARSIGRAALVKRSHAQAIAWWGARLAEALQHAHDRGVLHRDLKPSNILITADAEPMLLDFNLAQVPRREGHSPALATLGGTVAYMAPEHLDALAEGVTEGIDARADLYSLGVVLYEALGRRPFAQTTGALSVRGALRRAAEERRAGPPRLRAAHPEVPPALEAVVRKCLAPDPADRYAAAADLAADLQAVADGAPLRFAREPQPSRAWRWLRRNQRRIAVALALAIAALFLVIAWVERVRLNERHLGQIRERIADSIRFFKHDDLKAALSSAEEATRLAESHRPAPLATLPGLLDRLSRAVGLGEDDQKIVELRAEAREQAHLAQSAQKVREKADEFFRRAQELRFPLLGFGDDPKAVFPEVEQALNLFYVLSSREGWTTDPGAELRQLDAARAQRLLAEVNELMFLWLVAWDRAPARDPRHDRVALQVCDRALAFAEPPGPWRALRARFAQRLGEIGASAGPAGTDDPAAETSARACFQWGLLRDLEGRRDLAINWLDRATRIEPKNYWSQCYLAYLLERDGNHQMAREHYSNAVLLGSDRPWAYFNRARLYRAQNDRDRALEDLGLVLERSQGRLRLKAHLERGLVRLSLGDFQGARSDFEAVIRDGPGTPYSRAARLNRAQIDLNVGAIDRAWAEYDALVTADPADTSARLGRALLALKQGWAGWAEADLTDLLSRGPPRPEQAELLAHRALARWELGRPAAAADDARAAFRLDASPARERLLARMLLAAGQLDGWWLDDPAAVAALTPGGAALRADLLAAVDRLARAPAPGDRLLLTRAVLLSALNDPSAEAAANRAVALRPDAVAALLVRARVRARAGRHAAAMADVARGLALDPVDPRLLELRGQFALAAGQPRAALDDLDRALRRGAGGSVHPLRAQALMALNRWSEALRAWEDALKYDPEDPHAYLGRAWAFERLGQWDRVLGDLEQAAGWAGDRAGLLAQIALAHAVCLPHRPDRLPRFLALARRAVSAALPRRSDFRRI